MNLAYLRLLLDYHYWARDRALDAAASLTPEQYVKDLGSSFPSVRATLNHIHASEWLWFSRWRGISPTTRPPLDRFPDLASLRAGWAAQETALRAFLGSLGEDDVARVMEYSMIDGTPARARFWEMFVHVVNHAGYHRGQITTMLRQLGAKPPESTDMIAFFRTVADAPR